jgi:hypothetical protein
MQQSSVRSRVSLDMDPDDNPRDQGRGQLTEAPASAAAEDWSQGWSQDDRPTTAFASVETGITQPSIKPRSAASLADMVGLVDILTTSYN